MDWNVNANGSERLLFLLPGMKGRHCEEWALSPICSGRKVHRISTLWTNNRSHLETFGGTSSNVEDGSVRSSRWRNDMHDDLRGFFRGSIQTFRALLGGAGQPKDLRMPRGYVRPLPFLSRRQDLRRGARPLPQAE